MHILFAHLFGVLLEFSQLVFAPDFFLLFEAQKVSKKASRHNAPWFSGLQVEKDDGLIFSLASGWLLDSPLIFA
ncbi:MAG: hypothetical protein SH848_15510 [Saprospiraceae bacterium]|nr:hypothetical protein [Saprospiraceae bacterium]MDZ4705332.1 hypothetical protein [Saprospiraceae bacterium]